MEGKVDEAIKIIERKIGKQWKSLARALGFEKTDIDAITYENPNDLKECIYSFFNQWKEKQGSEANVLKLVNGLLKAELYSIANEVSVQCLGRQISSRYLHKDAVSNPSVPLPSEVERDKPAVTVGNTSTSHDIVTSVTAPTTPTTTSTTSSSKLPRQTFEVGDMIRVKGAEDKGGGVVKWIGSLSGSPLQVAGLEMDNPWEGGHDGLWQGQRHFKCPKGHGLYLPLSRIMKDPMFSPDKVPIDLNDLASATGTSPALHRSVSDNTTSTTTTKKRSNENVSAEKILDKFLELTATAPGDSTNVPSDGVLKVTFPGDRVGLLIGTDGATVREIQDKTHTTINISHNRYLPTSNATALIIGSKENCENALILMCQKLNEKICRLHAIEETISVPSNSVGRIIGTDGGTKRAIEKLSGAKVKIEQEEDILSRLLSDAKIVIKGSEEQINRAKQLIERARLGENIVLLQSVLTEVFQVMKEMGFELS